MPVLAVDDYPSAIADLPSVRAHLNFPNPGSSSDSDTELAGFIAAAEDVVRQECDDVLPVTYTETVQPFGDGQRVLLGHVPVLAVTSVATGCVGDGTTLTTVDASTYLLADADTGVLRRIGCRWGTDVQVTYLAGRNAVPPSVRLAALELIAEWWQHSQQGAFATPTGGAIGASQYDEIDTAPGYSAGVPYRVLELLKPYRRAPRVG